MREAKLPLDSIELALRSLPGKLRLESELTLGLPDEWLTGVTPAMISSKVSAGELWVERASPCRLHVDPVVTCGLSMVADESPHERRLVNAIRACSQVEAWELLGLQLNRCPRPMDENGQHVPGSLFYITHLTNSSNHLVCQQTTARAEIRRLTCRLWFDFVTQPANKRATGQQEPVQKATSADSSRVTRSGTKRSMQQSSVNVPSQPEQLSSAEFDHSVMILVRGSLYTLLGIKKPTPQIRRLRSFESPSLLEIAPAAFNMRYLQEVVQRAPFLHSISSVLARLASDAQSSSLRQKVASLAMGTAEASDMQTSPVHSTQERRFTDKYDYVDGIGKMIWPVLQAGPSNTKLYLEKLPQDRASGANVDLQLNGDFNPVHDPSQQFEPEGLSSGEQGNDKVEADDAKLGLHSDLHDMDDRPSWDLRYHLDGPLHFPECTQEQEGPPSLHSEDQRFDSSSREHMQIYHPRVPQYGQSWQTFQEDDSYGDDYDNDQYLDEEWDTVDYYDMGHYSWVPGNDNELASSYIGFGYDFELEAEDRPYSSSSLAPRTVLEREARILEDYFADESQRTDITASQYSRSEHIDQFEEYDQVFVDEFGDEYVYEESHMLVYDGQHTVNDDTLSSHITPWDEM
ncbi:hypothetical protein PgNI_06081 [Pyricularia grisea]|uniref:Uncharacterized protein n=1 Tax=Pyricularia grisea TaxID=148305 RepID=A0A6P8B529_PYRGI|nr:hypothetical protein PgNI_06081 [Pyricularia grisea]TLD10373.1 hypothetical protein PgNI_06081 [Pyricularia grisea]